MSTLNGEIALVTGAGRAAGMGRAIALRLAMLGADVIVTDIARNAPDLDIKEVGLGMSPEELEETAEQVRRLGRRSVAIPIDVTNAASVADGLAAARSLLGEVTVLVNNAGTVVGVGSFEDITDAQWELSFRVNVMGAVAMSRAVLPGMRAAGKGGIINIASTLGIAALPEYGAYVASKHAVVGLTRLLSQELAPYGIRTNAVAPGFIDTDMGKAEMVKIASAKGISVEEARKAIIDEIPLHRLGGSADVANTVAWLAGPEAAYVNGAIIPVHGGLISGFA
ncbi:SDR family NAD(P)-dependent oxidoreductase [Acinetobacter guillouiae]|uniref:SDR family NAD(P)-dependent oxidoreductase n=1 Tax=Acinetobacter guillouiae TaxID=106649 RepID=UPI002FD9D803